MFSPALRQPIFQFLTNISLVLKFISINIDSFNYLPKYYDQNISILRYLLIINVINQITSYPQVFKNWMFCTWWNTLMILSRHQYQAPYLNPKSTRISHSFRLEYTETLPKMHRSLCGLYLLCLWKWWFEMSITIGGIKFWGIQ